MPNVEPGFTDEERAMLKSVGVRPGVSKPPALWIAQALFAFYCALFSIGALQSLRENPGGAAFSVFLAFALVALIVGIQKRKNWAHPAVSAVLGILALLAFARQFSGTDAGPMEVQPGERSGAAVGGVFACILFVALAVRVAFGNGARTYLSNTTVDGPG
jgi:hypothetical protein